MFLKFFISSVNAGNKQLGPINYSRRSGASLSFSRAGLSLVDVSAYRRLKNHDIRPKMDGWTYR